MLNKIFAVITLLTISHVSMAAGIVVFDPEEAVARTQQVQIAMKKLSEDKGMIQLKNQEDSYVADLKALTDEQNAKGMTWGDEEKKKFTDDVQEIQKKRQALRQKFQAEQNAVLGPIFEEIQPLMDKAIDKIITSENISLVLTRQAAVRAHPSADITAKVAAEIDRAVSVKASEKKK